LGLVVVGVLDFQQLLAQAVQVAVAVEVPRVGAGLGRSVC
jgi:hypothetical protein